MSYRSEGLTHVDLFSGIGGFALAARWTGFRTVAFCERDAWCQRVLRKHWPDVPVYDDVRTFPGTSYPDVTLLTGGFPCQPFSVAGKRAGKEDDRYLWPEMLRVIEAVRPDWVIGENVPGVINMELDTVLSDLEGKDYACWPVTIPACAVDAPHRRERVWIVANTYSKRRYGKCISVQPGESLQNSTHADRRSTDVAYYGSIQQQRQASRVSWGQQKQSETHQFGRHRGRKENGMWLPEPNVGRVANGVPCGVDRVRGLGNALVPQVAAQLMAIIAGIRDDELPF